MFSQPKWHLGSWAYEWNANGSVKKVKRPDGKEVTFAYDALGRRIKKKFNNKIVRYLWDNNVILHEWEYNAADEPQLLVSPIGEVTFDKEEPVENLITWVYENGSFVPIGKLTQNESFSIVSDYLGTPIRAYDEEGNLVWERELDIYRKVKTETRESANFVPFRYQGQYYDSKIDLCYNRFRYYDCNTGSYISQDPISILGGFNIYAYVHDVNGWVDIFGLRKGGGYSGVRNSNVGGEVNHIPAWKSIELAAEMNSSLQNLPTYGTAPSIHTERNIMSISMK
ncbi:RHS repeat domain-containing protein [Capnocytophaga canimorsus]|uniref:RHS repeat domain-containing protein n=1 Tax=Capnocytophaga canimorsus TaxID=28188 RepID=UPI00384F1420